METWLGVVLGLITGIGVTSVHPAIDPGRWIAAVAGVLGGWAGASWWGADLAAHVSGHSYAGAAIGGAIGGFALALLVGIGIGIWRRSARRSAAHDRPRHD